MIAIITRKLHEKISIELEDGQKIIVQYVRKKGRAVSLLIDFPENLKVSRINEDREAS